MKAKYVLSSSDPQVMSELSKKLGFKSESISVYSDADLQRRLQAAEAAGVRDKIHVQRLLDYEDSIG